VADAPTWAAAAGEVGVSPSALSQGLAELERRVGVELFDRDGRRRVLRDSAGPVLDHARQVVALTADLAAWAARRRGAHSGRVRLGMIDIAAVVHFPEVVRRFRAERPDVELTLSVAPSAELLDGLRSGELDAAVCVVPSASAPGVDVEPLLDEALVVVAPAATTIDAPDSWGPWVLFPTGSHTRHRIDERLRELGAPRRVVAESHQPEVIVQMVALGLGWAVLPVDQAGHGPGVVIGPEVLRRQLALVTRGGAVRDPAVDELAARLRRA
jgi:DNA-binding transcriptional LysR family regulator